MNRLPVSDELDEQILLHILKKGAGQYECTVCGKVMHNFSHLRDHVEGKHIEQRVMPCPYCHKVSRTRRGVALHLIHDHLDIIVDQCPYCEFVAKTSNSLAHHISRQHRNVFTDPLKSD